MDDIRKLLRSLRVREGLDQADLAEKLGVSRSAVANWETLRAKMAPEHQEKLIKIYPDVMTADDLPRASRQKWQIKTWGPISAGRGNAQMPNLTDSYVPADFDREDFGAMSVDGDSMMPFLHPSDLVIFRDWRQAKINHIMAAVLPDEGEWCVKLLVYENGKFKLRSLNPAYEDIDLEDVELRGFLVGIIRDDGPERLIRLNPHGLQPSRF